MASALEPSGSFLYACETISEIERRSYFTHRKQSESDKHPCVNGKSRREALPALPPLPGQGCSRAPLTQCRNQINYGEKVVGSPTFLHINRRTRHCVGHSPGRDLSLPDIRVLSRPCTSCAGVPDLPHDGVVTYLTHPWVRSGERSGQSIARQYSVALRCRRLIPSGNQCRVARHP